MSYEKNIKNYGIIAGDKRFAYLAEELAKKGNFVKVFAFDKYPFGTMVEKCTLERLIDNSDYIIFPTPFSLDNDTLYTSYCYDPPLISTICEKVKGKKIYCNISDDYLPDELVSNNSTYDYTNSKTYNIKIADIISQEALSIALANSEKLLTSSRCVVVGYNDLGFLICEKLLRLGATVMLCEDDIEKQYIAKCRGILTCTKADIAKTISADYLFNCEKNVKFDNDCTEYLLSNAIVIDMVKNGIDGEFLAKMNVALYRTNSIVGRYAPRSYAQAIDIN